MAYCVAVGQKQGQRQRAKLKRQTWIARARVLGTSDPALISESFVEGVWKPRGCIERIM